MILIPSLKIYCAPSKIPNAGNGIFARAPIKKDELIEKCPIVLVAEHEVPDLRKTELMNYYFMWGDDKNFHKAAICLGFGSLYNHSYTPNATYKKNLTDNYIEFIAIEDIQKDQEITVNYNHGNPNDKATLWIPSIPPADS